MKKLAFALLAAALALAAGGCMDISDWFEAEEQDVPIEHGTTTGNIINCGFAVQYGGDLLTCYTGNTAYTKGSLVRSNPDTGESSLVLDSAGLYMSVDGDTLYYCLEDGVYATTVEAPDPQRVIEGEITLLQFCCGRLYFIQDGGIECAGMDGAKAADFARVENARCLNVYGDALYYADARTGYILKADLTGGGIETVYGQSVGMFIVIDDVIYFIDGADGYIRRTALSEPSVVETVVAYPCSGFNVNRYGIYYTREVDGRSLCCNAGADGYQEQVLPDFGISAWHAACLWNESALIVPVENLPTGP
jgi:hypothetical protein